MTQAAFAEKIGCSRMMIYAYELGHSKPGNKIIKAMLDVAKEHNIEINIEDFFKE
jgi:transcriptional regulator with XRE-family HTH domain